MAPNRGCFKLSVSGTADLGPSQWKGKKVFPQPRHWVCITDIINDGSSVPGCWNLEIRGEKSLQLRRPHSLASHSKLKRWGLSLSLFADKASLAFKGGYSSDY